MENILSRNIEIWITVMILNLHWILNKIRFKHRVDILFNRLSRGVEVLELIEMGNYVCLFMFKICLTPANANIFTLCICMFLSRL